MFDWLNGVLVGDDDSGPTDPEYDWDLESLIHSKPRFDQG